MLAVYYFIISTTGLPFQQHEYTLPIDEYHEILQNTAQAGLELRLSTPRMAFMRTHTT